jgi:hypothetical protein
MRPTRRAERILSEEVQELAALAAYERSGKARRQREIFDGVLACLVIGLLTFLGTWAWAIHWSAPQ